MSGEVKDEQAIIIQRMCSMIEEVWHDENIGPPKLDWYWVSTKAP